VGVELNPRAHELAVENVALNRVVNVRLLRGDAREAIGMLAENNESFDRVTMPLPHTAIEFIPDVLRVVKEGAIIHYYGFFPEGEFARDPGARGCVRALGTQARVVAHRARGAASAQGVAYLRRRYRRIRMLIIVP
jgi:tRNA G37 N-methylase Trm5